MRLCIKDHGDIMESLRNYCDVEHIENYNHPIRGKSNIAKSIKFRSLPNILIFCLRRTDY